MLKSGRAKCIGGPNAKITVYSTHAHNEYLVLKLVENAVNIL